jgi:hypothetical protein
MTFRKKEFLLIVILFALFSVQQAIGQSEKLQLDKWITNWYLLGPLTLEEGSSEIEHLKGFDNDVLAKFGGEKNLRVELEKGVKVKDTTLKWIDYKGTESVISLDNAISKKSFVAAYAYTEIDVDKEGVFNFSLGTNDGGRLWVNGEEVWDYTKARGCKPDDNIIPVYLKKGKNKILLKVEERGFSWQFCARIIPFEVDKSISNGAFTVVTSQNGTSELQTSLSEAVTNNLFRSTKIEIYSNEIGTPLIWSGNWNKKERMKLKIKKSEYKLYTIRIKAERRDGKTFTDEFTFKSGKRNSYTLFENRKTDYKIIVGEDASESEIWAASELRKSLMEISGANFMIENDNSPITENELIIGYNRHSQKLLGKNFKEPELLDESNYYKNIQSNILFMGGKQRGTMYSVFSFLENEFGVRWYTPGVTVIPTKEKFAFDYIHNFEQPSIQVRNDFFFEAFNPVWAAHNKINGAMNSRKQVGGIEGYWAVHTFYRFMPPSEFYDEHPEYYSLIDGKRIHEQAQLCLTNPDVLDIITDRLKLAMKENPDNLIYSVSQNDWRNPCQCSSCQAIVKEEESEAGIMVWFVNKIADRIKDEFPDKYIGTLAYQYTRKAPINIKPKENVVIRLCSIECCFAHDFRSCPENQSFIVDLEQWAAISPHMYIWDYVVNFRHYIKPYPNFKVLQSNIKAFRDNKSIGIMEQGAYQSRGGELSELRTYVISKLLWNADCDVDAVINDFMYGYYGRSGQFVREYFDLLHNQITPYTHIHCLEASNNMFTSVFTNKADKIFDKAEVVAENDIIKRRVEMARLSLMYLKCEIDPVSAKQDGTYARFNEIVEREGVTHFAESGKPAFDDFHNRLINTK